VISQIINSGFKAERSCDLEGIWPLLGVSRFMMSLLRLSVIVHSGLRCHLAMNYDGNALTRRYFIKV